MYAIFFRSYYYVRSRSVGDEFQILSQKNNNKDYILFQIEALNLVRILFYRQLLPTPIATLMLILVRYSLSNL
jgi:hypothetical protein